MSDKYLKQIADELKLIRIELQKENEYYAPEEPEPLEDIPINEQLNHMFRKKDNG